MTLAMIEACLMIASLDLLVQLNLHIHDQQSWQASQAVSIDVLRSSPILEYLSDSPESCVRGDAMEQIDCEALTHNLRHAAGQTASATVSAEQASKPLSRSPFSRQLRFAITIFKLRIPAFMLHCRMAT